MNDKGSPKRQCFGTLLIFACYRKIYWLGLDFETYEGSLFQADTDGRDVTVILDGLRRPSNLVYDVILDDVYWMEYLNGSHLIRSMDAKDKKTMRVKLF